MSPTEKAEFPFDTDAKQPPAEFEHFRHVDGGYYRRVGVATHTDDLSSLVVYEHVWPFERRLWARPAPQWEGRFMAVSAEEVARACAQDRHQAQAEVQQAKDRRRHGQG